MPSIAEDAHAVVLVADYISIDAGNKVNFMGAGFTLANLQAGMTAPMHVGLIIDLHGRHAGEQFTFTLELRDRETNELVSVPGPANALEALRFSQLATAERAAFPGLRIPDDIPCRVQMTLGFPSGLPLTPGHRYSWRLLIENTHRKSWVANFYVPEPAAGPVFGGPAGPRDIPGVQSIEDELEDEGGPEDTI